MAYEYKVIHDIGPKALQSSLNTDAADWEVISVVVQNFKNEYGATQSRLVATMRRKKKETIPSAPQPEPTIRPKP